MVRHHALQLGRGPTRGRAFHDENIVVVVLQDLLITAERRLVEAGGTDAVLHSRRAFQDVLRPYLRSTIERPTGFKLVAFMSANHIDPDLAADLFILDRRVPGGRAEPDSRRVA